MSREEARELLVNISAYDVDNKNIVKQEAMELAIEALEQEPCDNVCEWFEQYVDIVTDIVELRFSDGTVKRAKRGLYMRDIEKSIRRMLIDQMADEKKQEPCEDCISRQAVLEAIDVKAWEFCDYLISKNRNDEQKPVSHFADNLRECISEALPPVTPAEKVGHWIDHQMDIWIYAKCSECETIHDTRTNYCPHCGAKMEEVEEV